MLPRKVDGNVGYLLLGKIDGETVFDRARDGARDHVFAAGAHTLQIGWAHWHIAPLVDAREGNRYVYDQVLAENGVDLVALPIKGGAHAVRHLVKGLGRNDTRGEIVCGEEGVDRDARKAEAAVHLVADDPQAVAGTGLDGQAVLGKEPLGRVQVMGDGGARDEQHARKIPKRYPVGAEQEILHEVAGTPFGR